MNTGEQIITQTKKWISDVVIGCNFCPFAARVMKQDKIYYRVSFNTLLSKCMDDLLEETSRLDNNDNIETSFLILPNAFQDFNDYLDAVAFTEKLLKKNGYEGVYQVASFHPDYLFAGSTTNDAANYTNRSPYAMLHLLREDSITAALEHYREPESIPVRNVQFAREKGPVYMKMLRDSCMSG